MDEFVEFVTDLHREKHQVYGDSWKRRGETIGILANIARKVDRLGVAGGGDTSADTAIDLLVYLAKYRLWLTDEHQLPLPRSVNPFLKNNVGYSDLTLPVDMMIEAMKPEELRQHELQDTIRFLKETFDHLETNINVQDDPAVRANLVDEALPAAYQLARTLWFEEQAEQEAVNAYRFWKGENR